LESFTKWILFHHFVELPSTLYSISLQRHLI
jgi:hypothetical protein